MPIPQASATFNSADLNDDYQFKFALKNMLPIPSNSEQQILLDEYSSQLSQFSISINRIIKEELSDDNCVFLLKLLAGMYTLLKTTLLSPPVYRELFVGVCRIENDVQRFISNWAMTVSDGKQEELFELGWWCESALPRAYLVTLLFSSLPALLKDPKYISSTFSVCKSLQHPLKGSFLYSRLHSFILRIFFIEDLSEEMEALCTGYSVETFTTLLRYFCRWHHSLPTRTTEPSYTASLFHEAFEGIFNQISRMTSYDVFEAILLPTFLVEIVNSGDSLAQTLTFQSIINEFDPQYLFAQLSQLIQTSSQFASGIDLKGLLDSLYRKVQIVRTGSEEVFFETIWEETSKLIKNRSEIDQCDTVIISSLALSMISHGQMSHVIKPIEMVLEFLIKTLKNIRPEGFNSETCAVGKEIVELIRVLSEEFDFQNVILKLVGLPELLDCLKPASSRKCCLRILLPKLKELCDENTYPGVIKLFSCYCQRDLVQLLDGDSEIDSLTEDLNEFSKEMISRLPEGKIEVFFDSINSSSSCLNLFLIPELLERVTDASLCKKLITSFLYNTSTVLHQRALTAAAGAWIEPDYTKLMAVKMNLRVIETVGLVDSYEFYTEILTILSNNVSQDQLKIQIISRVLDSLNENSSKITSDDDYKCLIDHLAKESSQLLRKSDRCKLLLKIIEMTSSDSNEKYVEQVINLLNQLTSNEKDSKFQMACELLDGILMKTRGMNLIEEKLFLWALELSQREPQKELEFYSIKIKHDSKYKDNKDAEYKEIIIDSDYTHTNTITYNNNNNLIFSEEEHVKIEELTSDDLQKLKIFESFPTEP